MSYNLPVGVKTELDDCNMICEHCDRIDDVDNGEYVNHMWYCNECYKELFKKCPKCEVIISIDEELCEDCLSEKTYDESAQGMFEKLGYVLDENDIEDIHYRETLETYACNHIIFYNNLYAYDCFGGSTGISNYIDMPLHKAIIQQLKELKWL